MDLKGVVALVTGGNGGLGQRICHALAREGVHIAVMYARSRAQAESVAGELASRYQIKAQAFACDITDGAAVDRLVGEVDKAFGRLDVLINDAAYNLSIPFADLDGLTPEVWDRIIALDFRGIERQRQKTLQSVGFGCGSDCISVPLCLPGAAIAAVPAPAIQAMKTRVRFPRDATLYRPASAVGTSALQLVAINLN